jgi:hypothetical protein
VTAPTRLTPPWPGNKENPMKSVNQLLRRTGAAVFLIAFACSAVADHKPVKPKKAETPEQAVEYLAAASKAGDLQAALDQIAQPFHDLMLWHVLQEEADDILTAALDQKFGKEKRTGFRMEVKQDLLRIQKVEILSKDKGTDARVKLGVRETVKSFHHEGHDVVETSYLAVRDGDHWKVLRPFTALIFDAPSGDVTEEGVSTKGPGGKESGVFKVTFKKDADVVARDWQKALEKREGQTLRELLERARRDREAAEKVAARVKAGDYKTRAEATDAYEAALRPAGKKGR